MSNDTGTGIVQPLFFIGVVENREDPRAEGRVQVRAFGLHGSNRDISTQDLPWATLIIGNHDVNFTPPPLNAWVFGFFVDGRDAQQPMILGLIPTQSSELVDPAVTGWGAIPTEDYDLQMQGSRPRDIGTSPMSNLATGEFTNETYNTPLEMNRSVGIPIAGGLARGYAFGGNSNSWSNDSGESADEFSARRGPLSSSERESIAVLDADTEFQQELDLLTQRYGVSREQVYGIIAGESGYNPGVVNQFGYSGLFQFGQPALDDINSRQGTNYTTRQIASMSPAQQTRVYSQYLDRWGYRNSSGLGVMQAAPAFGDRSGGTEVYAVNTSAWRNNPAWRGADGRITVDSINAYYNRRNPPTASDSLLSGGSGDNAVAGGEGNDTFSRAAEIRARIAVIDDELVTLATTANREQMDTLLAERTALENELATLSSGGSTNPQAGAPYTGYLDPTNVSSGGAASWDEPASAYGARYPYNRVIETAAGHSIELDDTPGAERIMIWHSSGSYFQISNTSTTQKSVGESYDIQEGNSHVYIRGNSIVTIDGDCHTLIKGDKVEEIQGNYRQIVHGDIMMGAARSVEINGAARTDIRSASLSLDSNVENLNIRTSQNIVFESGNSIHLSSQNIRISATENMSMSGGAGLFLESDQNTHMRSGGNLFLNPAESIFLRADGGSISMQATGSIRANSDTFISLKSASAMDLQADGNMVFASDASINMTSAGLVALSSESMYLNSGGGDLNVASGANLRLLSVSNFDLKGETMSIESTGTVNMKSGSDLNVESGSNLNLLGSGNARLTGANTHIRGGTTFIDDNIQMATGNAVAASGAASAGSAAVKEPIEPAPYLGEFDGPDIAAQADSAPSSLAPMPAESGASGPASPPTQSIPTRDIISGPWV